MKAPWQWGSDVPVRSAPASPPRAAATRGRSLLAAIPLLALSLIAGGCEPVELESSPERTPAPLMSPEGAEWLERSGRELEERPGLVLDAMELRDGDRVAEIGTGTGYFARRISPRVGAEGEVWAVDIQQEMLDIVSESIDRGGLDNIELVLGDPDDPKLPAGYFDWILLVDTYHEFQKPEQMLEKIRAALGPGGRVALVEYRLEGASAEHIRIEHRMSINQILAEWLPNGFDLVGRIDTLPSQHFLIFEPSE